MPTWPFWMTPRCRRLATEAITRTLMYYMTGIKCKQRFSSTVSNEDLLLQTPIGSSAILGQIVSLDGSSDGSPWFYLKVSFACPFVGAALHEGTPNLNYFPLHRATIKELLFKNKRGNRRADQMLQSALIIFIKKISAYELVAPKTRSCPPFKRHIYL